MFVAANAVLEHEFKTCFPRVAPVYVTDTSVFKLHSVFTQTPRTEKASCGLTFMRRSFLCMKNADVHHA